MSGTQQSKAPGTTPPLPLDGVRVMDFSRLLPGPWATQMLSELGADVVKIEQPGIGDPSRQNHPKFHEESVYFHLVNGNKRSITLNLAKPEAAPVIRRLLARADVIIESYRPGVARKLGIDYASVAAYNPRVIYCSVTGFGQTGPMAHVAGHDLVIQGMTGHMARAMTPGTPPPVPGFQAGDFAGALMTVIGVQAALTQREKTGVGNELDISMFEALLHMCPIPLTSAIARLAGHSGEPAQEVFGRNPRYATYLTQDQKPVAVSLLETKIWSDFCTDIGRPDLIAADETPADRLTAHGERAPAYHAALKRYCAEHTWAQIQAHMIKTGLAVCTIASPDEALAQAHVIERGMLEYIDHPREGRIPHLVNPLSRAGLARRTHRPAPMLGEHTDDVLGEAGYSAAEITALRAARIFE